MTRPKSTKIKETLRWCECLFSGRDWENGRIIVIICFVTSMCREAYKSCEPTCWVLHSENAKDLRKKGIQTPPKVSCPYVYFSAAYVYHTELSVACFSGWKMSLHHHHILLGLLGCPWAPALGDFPAHTAAGFCSEVSPSSHRHTRSKKHQSCHCLWTKLSNLF